MPAINAIRPITNEIIRNKGKQLNTGCQLIDSKNLVNVHIGQPTPVKFGGMGKVGASKFKRKNVKCDDTDNKSIGFAISCFGMYPKN